MMGTCFFLTFLVIRTIAGSGCCGDACSVDLDCSAGMFCCLSHKKCMDTTTASTVGATCDTCQLLPMAMTKETCQSANGCNAGPACSSYMDCDGGFGYCNTCPDGSQCCGTSGGSSGCGTKPPSHTHAPHSHTHAPHSHAPPPGPSPACHIIGNPSWNHYCQQAAVCGNDKSPGGCPDTHCRTSTAPMEVCCSKECCPSSCICTGPQHSCGPGAEGGNLPCCQDNPAQQLECTCLGFCDNVGELICDWPPSPPLPRPACYGDTCGPGDSCCNHTDCNADTKTCTCGGLLAACGKPGLAVCCEGCE